MVSWIAKIFAENLSSAIVKLPVPLHFLTPAGDDVEMGRGSYRVGEAELWLKLVPVGEGAESAILIEAMAGMHEKQLAEVTAQLHQDPENSDVYHLALLLPEGSGFEAIGTVSGIRPRGFQMVFLNKANLQMAAKEPPSSGGQTIFPTLVTNKPGYATKVDSDWTDRCVPNVREQITKTLHNGKDNRDLLAYRSGGNGSPSLENKGLHKAGRTGRNSWKHRQGIARYFSGTHNYFYISNSVTPAWTKAKKFGGVEVVQWANNRSSGRLGSNIGNNRRQTPSSNFSVMKYIQELGTDHAGGIQVYGRFLAVPYFANRDFIRLYDLQNPRSPRPLRALQSTKNVQFGFAALTRLNNGRYLAIGGDDRIEVFVTEGTSPLGNWKSHSAWNPVKGFVDDPRGPANMKYQGAQFITDCSGILYLALTRKSINALGSYQNDWIDVWRTYVHSTKGTYSIGLSKVFNRHMYCGGGGDTLWCNFVAGAGMYIDPRNGDLLAYGIEHWNDGPTVNGVGSTKMKEFRQK